MRTKKYEKPFILKGAYQLAKRNGFSSLAARHVARELSISTQPIYLEFGNMENLRIELIDYVFKEVRAKYFSVNISIEEFIKSVLLFVNTEEELYLSLLTEKVVNSQFTNYLYEIFCENKEVQECYREEKFFMFRLIISLADTSRGEQTQLSNEKISEREINKIIQLYLKNRLPN